MKSQVAPECCDEISDVGSGVGSRLQSSNGLKSGGSSKTIGSSLDLLPSAAPPSVAVPASNAAR